MISTPGASLPFLGFFVFEDDFAAEGIDRSSRHLASVVIRVAAESEGSDERDISRDRFRDNFLGDSYTDLLQRLLQRSKSDAPYQQPFPDASCKIAHQHGGTVFEKAKHHHFFVQ